MRAGVAAIPKPRAGESCDREGGVRGGVCVRGEAGWRVAKNVMVRVVKGRW